MRGCTNCNSLWRSYTLTFSFHIHIFLLSHTYIHLSHYITFTYSFLSHACISTFTHTFILLLYIYTHFTFQHMHVFWHSCTYIYTSTYIFFILTYLHSYIVMYVSSFFFFCIHYFLFKQEVNLKPRACSSSDRCPTFCYGFWVEHVSWKWCARCVFSCLVGVSEMSAQSAATCI